MKNGDELLYQDPDDPAGQLRKAQISIGEDGVLQLTDIHSTYDDLVVSHGDRWTVRQCAVLIFKTNFTKETDLLNVTCITFSECVRLSELA